MTAYTWYVNCLRACVHRQEHKVVVTLQLRVVGKVAQLVVVFVQLEML